MAIYRHRGKWTYEFKKHGHRYRKEGYETRAEAVEDEAKARATAKRMNTDLLKLLNSRLRELELRRTKDHFERNKLLFEKLITKWGTKKQVIREDVEKVIDETAKISKAKANKEITLIKALFNHGIDKQWFDINPTKGIKPFGTEKKSKYIPPEEDIEKVLAVATEEQRCYLLTYKLTMARMREINRLKWTDVYDDYIVLKTRKAKNSQVSIRAIPFTPTLRKIFEALPRKGEYVFTSPLTGRNYDTRIGMIKSLCAKAGVKKFTFHNLRHWGASKLAEENVPLPDIQKLLGHTRPTTTDTYIQSLKPTLVEAISKLDANTNTRQTPRRSN